MPNLSIPKLAMPGPGAGDKEDGVEVAVVAVAELAMPELAMPKLAMPNLSMPELAMPKLAMPNLAIPKLEMPKPGTEETEDRVEIAIMAVNEISEHAMAGATDVTI